MLVIMSMLTAQKSDAVLWQGSGWRAVEAQHKNATMALVHGDLYRQSILEDIIEEAKPAMPDAASGLHFLLATPFRYRSPPPSASRFRAEHAPGVFYGAEKTETACAEVGYWRLRFWIDSEGLRDQQTSFTMTLFEFHGKTPFCWDLTRQPFADRRADWTHPTDYRQTQALATAARDCGIEMIRAESVRHPTEGRCLAILTPAVFKAVADPYRWNQQSWELFIKPPNMVVWQRHLNSESFAFSF